jgi:hypothetical protein
VAWVWDKTHIKKHDITMSLNVTVVAGCISLLYEIVVEYPVRGWEGNINIK